MWRKILFIQLLFLFYEKILSEINTKNQIVELNDKNIDKFLNKNDNVLLMFYTEWCSGCKDLIPIYEELSIKVKEKNMNILIARIDIDKNLNSEKNFNVKAYPMILLINKSEKIKYEGEANLNQLIEFIQNELEETRDLTINDLNNLSEIMNTNKNNSNILLFLGDKESRSKREYKALKRSLKSFPKFILIQSNSNELLSQLSIAKIDQPFHLIMFKYSSRRKAYKPGTLVHIYSKDFEESTLREKLSLIQSKYTFSPLNDKNFDYILEKGVSSLIVVFKNLLDTDHVNDVERILKKVNTDNKGLLFHYKSNYNDKNTKLLIDVMKINNHSFPIVIIIEGITDEMNKYVYSEKISLEGITKFINDYKSNKLSNFIGSEPIPSNPINKYGVINIVGNTFEEVVINSSGKDVLVLFCSLSHKDCLISHDRLNLLSQKFNKSDIIFGNIDPTVNEISHFRVKSIPSFVLFLEKNKTQQEEKETVKYKGNFSTQDLSLFLQKNSKKKLLESKLDNQKDIYSREKNLTIIKKRLDEDDLALNDFFENKNIDEGFNFDNEDDDTFENEGSGENLYRKTDL